MEDMKKAKAVLEKHGATNLESYTLINNFGWTFDMDGRRYDARYWANCYGVPLERWEISVGKTYRDENGQPCVYPMDKELQETIERELNS